MLGTLRKHFIKLSLIDLEKKGQAQIRQNNFKSLGKNQNNVISTEESGM